MKYWTSAVVFALGFSVGGIACDDPLPPPVSRQTADAGANGRQDETRKPASGAGSSAVFRGGGGVATGDQTVLQGYLHVSPPEQLQGHGYQLDVELTR